MAVPAEELIEIGYREQLRRDGVIKYMGGKVEFMYRGYMDGCDMAILFHTSAKPDGDFAFTSSRGSNGCVTKEMVFEGRASHAGGSPHLGINALYAANLAINAVNALRETFRDNDHIRVIDHPQGRRRVNAIRAGTVESYVRGGPCRRLSAPTSASTAQWRARRWPWARMFC
jgi:acetylornithine deacetylase/succinyl-diaminopimelate desuccinylase-like protein